MDLQFDAPFTNAFPWLEGLPGGDPAHNGHFGLSSPSSFAYPIVMNFSDFINDQMRNIFGYPTKKGTAIKRTLPWQCPYFPRMWASRVEGVKFVNFQGKVTDGRPATGGTRSSFQYAIPTILFETPPYAVLQDGALTPGDPVKGEQLRFISKKMKPSVQNITRETGAFVWGAGVPDGQAGKTIDVRQGQRVLERRWTWKWYQVPDDGLFDSGGSLMGGTCAKLDAAVGCVNNAAFNGYPTQTLLFEDYEIEEWLAPFDASTINPSGSLGVPLLWNVILYFIHFDPPIDTGGGFTQRGHNLAPHPTRRYWYPYKTASGDDLYAATDFTQIFLMN